MAKNNDIKKIKVKRPINQSSKPRKNSKRRKKLGIVLSMVILILVTIFVFQFHLIMDYSGRLIGRDANVFGHVEKERFLGLNKDTRLTITYKHIFKWGKGRLICYNELGQKLWEKPMNGEDICIRGNGSSFVAADLNVGDLFLLDENGVMLKKEFGLGKIGRLIYTKDGIITCYLPEKKKLLIFDNKLIERASIAVSDGMLMDIEIADKADFIALTFFRLSGDGYHSQIFTYRKDGSDIGSINIEGQVLFDTQVTNTSLICVTDNHVYAYDFNNNEIWQNEIDRTIKKVCISKRNGTVILNLIRAKENLADDRPTNVLVRINKSGRLSKDIPISYDIERIDMAGDKTVFSTKYQIYVMSPTGKLDSILKLKDYLDKFHIFNNTYLGIEYSDYLDIIDLGS